MRYDQIFELQCQVQHYPWGARGRKGRKPFIAELENMTSDEGQPFAELWIGAHPKLPAEVIFDSGSVPLDAFIKTAAEEILGKKVVKRGFNSLPFLLKVLDCEQALSIQAHPDKKSAEVLNAKDPEHYPDANHKPEIAISIRGMEAFCEFRPIADIVTDLKRLDTLSIIFKDFMENSVEPRTNPRQWLRKAYAVVFDMPQNEVAENVRRLVSGIESRAPMTDHDRWVLKLMQQHPDDRGIIAAYFLNIVHLEPGQAVFLGPNEPHAYLQGAIIECMASSDNVVRAGLTSKFIDRKTLVDMLTYNDGPPAIMSGKASGEGELLYRVPVPEFQVEVYKHGDGYRVAYSADEVVSLMLVLEGNAVFEVGGETISAPRGSTWLWPAALDSLACQYLDPQTVIVRARPNLVQL